VLDWHLRVKRGYLHGHIVIAGPIHVLVGPFEELRGGEGPLLAHISDVELCFAFQKHLFVF